MNFHFRSAKDIYIKGLGLDEPDRGIQWDPNSKYARAARLGLCFKCFYEGTTDLTRRPASRAMPFCEHCMIELSYGTEKLERQKRLEVKLWFKD